MKTVRPDYCSRFCCIADRCRHTCCAGWEIDVDEEALWRYQKAKGPLGDKLRAVIETEDECPHFKLTKEERCPFLNPSGLCEIICEYGEEALCRICAEHPRFYNRIAGREEMGLGLCCEEAARLILGQKEKTVLLETGEEEEETDPFERRILEVRSQAFRIIQDRNCRVKERVSRLLETFSVRIPQASPKQWADFFASLEQMDPLWMQCLRALEEQGETEGDLPDLEIPFEQLICCFLYRHMPQAEGEADLKGQIAFAVLSYRILKRLCLIRERQGGCSFSDFAELARLYSSEIEYSEENTDAVLDLLWEENCTEA